MKVFAVRCNYKDNSDDSHWILTIRVSHGLEDVLSQIEKDLEKSEGGYQEGSLKLDSKVYMGLPDLLANIEELQNGKKEEDEALVKIKNFDHLIKK